ncbi:MAG: hypothetical protein JWO11_2371 [Nocardioides sp.]|nr:hypothetical protein [Nocardioides sp.]
MTDSAHRLVYEELATPQEMHADCRAVGGTLGLETPLQRAARLAVRPAPSIHFDEFTSDAPKREIRISDAAARLANALHLHLD